jgi:hypothetical protein
LIAKLFFLFFFLYANIIFKKSKVTDHFVSTICNDEKYFMSVHDEDKFLKQIVPFEVNAKYLHTYLHTLLIQALSQEELNEFMDSLGKPKPGSTPGEDWPRPKYLKANDIPEEVPLLPVILYYLKK